MNKMLAVCVLLIGAGAPQVLLAAERVFYEIVVTNPGTRSQGWHGTLFDAAGDPVEAEPGQSLYTNIGVFAAVACTDPWIPCGMIHADTLAWMQRHQSNIAMDSGQWAYRLFVVAEGTRSEGWRGELLHLARPIPEQKAVDTPMGPFVWLADPTPWGRHGWFHVAWAP